VCVVNSTSAVPALAQGLLNACSGDLAGKVCETCTYALLHASDLHVSTNRFTSIKHRDASSCIPPLTRKEVSSSTFDMMSPTMLTAISDAA